MNKCDLTGVWNSQEKTSYAGKWPLLEVSAKTGAGIGRLKKAILEHLFGEADGRQDGILITNVRQCRCLESARDSLAKAADALRQGLSEEFALFDLHRGLNQLGAVTGETTVDELLSEIFSRFCIGK